jgi:MtrB/PioB family decaheme-associated outer membrane protein
MLAWLIALPAAAQQPNTPAPQPGENTGVSRLPNPGQVDFGLRGTNYTEDSDEARYQRYRDLRNGAFADGFLWAKDTDSAFSDVRGSHVGYRDQQYTGNYNRFGKVKGSFSFNQIPLFFSEDTRTAYSEDTSGVLRLDGLPRAVQSGLATTSIYETQAIPFDLRLKRSITDARVVYTATPNLDFSVAFQNTLKKGGQAWAGTFGFANAVELPAPLDTQTTDLGAAAEWMTDRGGLRVGYEGSFFRNDVGTLVWDNPMRAVDSPTAGPAQGRMALWPNSNLNAGSVSGLIKLPANSQGTAYVSLGNVSQDEALIPFTVNTALPSIPLDRATADASARVTSTAFTFNTRPLTHLWFNARFRSYDYDNRTAVFRVANTVAYDTTFVPFAEGGTSPYGFNRKTFDAEASWTPMTFAALRAGYTHESVDQTFRTFDTTSENIVRLSADATGVRWLTVRAVYEHAKRTGSGLDEQTLDDIGEQVSLRQFDISDRTSNRLSAIVIVTPASLLSVNGTVFVAREDRPDTTFGLRSNDGTGASIGFDYAPRDGVAIGSSYQYERYTTLQGSRQASPGPQFNDPTRDWTTDAADRAHTVEVSADLLKLWRKTDVRFAYDLSHGESAYVYGVPANSTLPRVSQLPKVINTRNRLTADAQYLLTGHVAAGFSYWFEKYHVEDFAFSPTTVNTVAQPGFLALGYLYRPYTANTLWGRVTYRW